VKKSTLLAVAAAFALPAAWGAIQTSPQYAPTGTHLQSGTPGCSVSGYIVTCAGYDLAGVGKTNATATLLTTYTGTVICTNPGGNVAPGQTRPASASTSSPKLQSKNGKMTVPILTSTSDTATIEALLKMNTTCPNPKWKPSVEPGSIELVSYMYTLQFDGYGGNYLVITP